MTSAEIKQQIEAKKAEIGRLNAEKDELNRQYRDALQIEFEQQHGVKSGDKISTKSGKPFFYDKMIIDAFGWVMVLCHAVKNDGTPSKADRHVSISEF
jgi:hypothetical protein